MPHILGITSPYLNFLLCCMYQYSYMFVYFCIRSFVPSWLKCPILFLDKMMDRMAEYDKGMTGGLPLFAMQIAIVAVPILIFMAQRSV